MKTLYKKDSRGQIRQWSIWTNGEKLMQSSGLVGGKLIQHEKACTGKNIGKSNETSPEDQAKLELESEYKSKKDEGYFETQQEAKTEVVILPMLAKSYGDYKNKIDWTTAYVQPKLDGMRCLAHIKSGTVTLMSRDGKVIQNMDHIIKEFSLIKEDCILDGELYAHGLSFQENMKLIKKYRNGETENICFHSYDRVSEDSFTRRYLEIEFPSSDHVLFVDTLPIKNQQDLDKAHAENISEGYEGSIVRWGNQGYKIGGRSENLLKYKDFQDLALPILDIIPCEQRPEWGKPVFFWKGAKDDTLEAGMRYSHAERIDFLKNKKNYISKTAELRFFEYSDTGVPRFPVMVGIRLDK